MILLTGANGFLGNRIRRSLSGRDVVGLVRSAPRSAGDVRADLTDPDALERVPWGEITAVVHCASAIPARSKDYARTNVLGTRNLLARLDPARVHTFVLVSSVSVYALPTDAPELVFSEDAPAFTDEPYGLSKLTQEYLVEGFARGGARTVVLRPSSIYGPGNTSRTVLPIFVGLARENRRITVSGSRHYVQNFVHVDDVARVAVAAVGGEASGVFNVFSDDTVSIETLARRTCSALDSSSEIVVETNDDPFPRIAYRNERVKRAFGAAFRPLEEGIATLVG